MAAGDLYVAHVYFQLLGEHTHKLFVGRSFDGRRGEPHAQHSLMLSGNAAARGARHDAHRKPQLALSLCITEQWPLPFSTDDPDGPTHQKSSGDGLLEQPDEDEGHDG